LEAGVTANYLTDTKKQTAQKKTEKDFSST